MGELVMYILVNEEIRMGKGKAMGQAGHAVASWFYHRSSNYNQYRLKDYMEGQQKKIVLKCSQEKLQELERLGFITIRDAGHTQLEPNTLTCVNYGLYYKHEVPNWINELRLY